jgi:outer membrane protein assembly factor BamD
MAGLLVSCGLRRKPYDNPISKNTQQPDKVLFDKAISDIEHARYEVARLTLNTLINTYDSSEYLAKAKLAVADSWFREGGAHGLAQAEAEYKDFILFYPAMEESAEAQEKVCMIHYKQMEKPDRDSMQARRAEEECRQVLVQFPNSKFAPEASQILRNIQEVLAEGEYRVGDEYYRKRTQSGYSAAANRMLSLTNQYPLYSKSDFALWEMGESYGKLGKQFRKQAGEAYARIVKDYPLSPLVDSAKKKLTAMEMPIPDADPEAVKRMKFELENREKAGMLSRSLSVFKTGPDTWTAAKSGPPAMTSLRPTVPPSVPQPVAATGINDVTAGPAADPGVLDSKKDARLNPPTPSGLTLPAKCAAGETFLKTDAPEGKNLYKCSAAGAWTLESASAADPKKTGTP